MAADKQTIITAVFHFLIVVSILGAGAVAAFGLNRIEMNVSRRLSHHYGWRSLLLTGWIGTGFHELCHLACCKLLGLRVVDYKLYQPDTRTGTLGYVYFVQDKKGAGNALKRMFVGTAPLFFGLVALTGGLFALGWRTAAVTETFVPTGSFFLLLFRRTAESFTGLLRSEHLSSPVFWIWSYGSLAVGLHMAPSKADLKNTAWGFGLILAMIATALFFLQLFSAQAAQKTMSIVIQVSIAGGVTAAWALLLAFLYYSVVKLITYFFP